MPCRNSGGGDVRGLLNESNSIEQRCRAARSLQNASTTKRCTIRCISEAIGRVGRVLLLTGAFSSRGWRRVRGRSSLKLKPEMELALKLTKSPVRPCTCSWMDPLQIC
mmetsp:Transcript_14903/g.60782  ORF Transcript_14903/g.60782 Transcript_14903/m.60782 type:complete len:108 (+) Transcript_14903:1583-1906(+)